MTTSPFDAPFGIAHRDAKHEWNGLMKMDIRDKDGQYTADIELPGCKKEDIAIELNNGYLTVTANSRYENDEKGDDGQIHPPRTLHRPVLAQPLHRRAREAGGRESQI